MPASCAVPDQQLGTDACPSKHKLALGASPAQPSKHRLLPSVLMAADADEWPRPARVGTGAASLTDWLLICCSFSDWPHLNVTILARAPLQRMIIALKHPAGQAMVLRKQE